MNLTRREFMRTAAAVVGTAALTARPMLGDEGGSGMSPAINPVYLTGSMENWPLAELAGAGYRGLELPPACLEAAPAWKPAADAAGLRVVCVNALPELRPYLTGSLSDGVERRRRETREALLRTLARMRDLEIPLLVVAPSRVAENYQTADEARALLIESLRLLATAGDTTILLEAAPFRMATSSADIAGVVDEVAMPNVAAALDVGHAILNGEAPGEAAGALGGRLRYVQVHDAEVQPGVPRLDRHLPLGEGSLDQKEARAAIGDLPFAVSITPIGDPLAAARSALEWLQ